MIYQSINILFIFKILSYLCILFILLRFYYVINFFQRSKKKWSKNPSKLFKCFLLHFFLKSGKSGKSGKRKKTIIFEYDIWKKYLAYSKKRKWENYYS